MDTVIDSLMTVCGHSPESAVNIMLTAHTTGRAIAKTIVYELAEAMRDGLARAGITATIEET